MSERELQETVNAFLRRLSIPFWHREKGARNRPMARNTIQLDGAILAWPDLFIFTRSGAVFAELKDRSGRLRDNQAAMLEVLKGRGYPVMQVTPDNVAEFCKLIIKMECGDDKITA